MTEGIGTPGAPPSAPVLDSANRFWITGCLDRGIPFRHEVRADWVRCAQGVRGDWVRCARALKCPARPSSLERPEGETRGSGAPPGAPGGAPGGDSASLYRRGHWLNGGAPFRHETWADWVRCAQEVGGDVRTIRGGIRQWGMGSTDGVRGTQEPSGAEDGTGVRLRVSEGEPERDGESGAPPGALGGAPGEDFASR